MIKKLTKTEFLHRYDPELHPEDTSEFEAALRKALERVPDAVGLVLFENLQLDSSRLGERQALVVGPSNTYKSVEACEGKWLNDLPSQRQYPTGWIDRASFLEGKAKP